MHASNVYNNATLWFTENNNNNTHINHQQQKNHLEFGGISSMKSFQGGEYYSQVLKV